MPDQKPKELSGWIVVIKDLYQGDVIKYYAEDISTPPILLDGIKIINGYKPRNVYPSDTSKGEGSGLFAKVEYADGIYNLVVPTYRIVVIQNAKDLNNTEWCSRTKEEAQKLAQQKYDEAYEIWIKRHEDHPLSLWQWLFFGGFFEWWGNLFWRFNHRTFNETRWGMDFGDDPNKDDWE